MTLTEVLQVLSEFNTVCQANAIYLSSLATSKVKSLALPRRVFQFENFLIENDQHTIKSL